MPVRDQNPLVAPLKKVPHTPMPTVNMLGIHPVQLTHTFWEIRVRGFDRGEQEHELR